MKALQKPAEVTQGLWVMTLAAFDAPFHSKQVSDPLRTTARLILIMAMSLLNVVQPSFQPGCSNLSGGFGLGGYERPSFGIVPHGTSPAMLCAMFNPPKPFAVMIICTVTPEMALTGK